MAILNGVLDIAVTATVPAPTYFMQIFGMKTTVNVKWIGNRVSALYCDDPGPRYIVINEHPHQSDSVPGNGVGNPAIHYQF